MIKLKEIKSISIDMSTEKAPYNRIYAKPIEKQGDVLLCEFESANYDINKKGKDFTTGISEEMYLDQLKVKENMIKFFQEENTKLKGLLRKAKGIITAYRISGNQSTYSNDDMKECVAQIDQVLGEE